MKATGKLGDVTLRCGHEGVDAKNVASRFPKTAIDSATIVKGSRRGHHPRNPAWGLAWSVPWKRDIDTHHGNHKEHQRSGRRRREAVDRGDGEAPRERDASHAPGELVHAGADHQ